MRVVRIGVSLVAASLVGAVLTSASMAATRECQGLKVCVPVAGPWVVVPASSEVPRPRVEFQLSCPKGYVVGGVDVEVSDQAIDVAFLGASGSPVNPGITTSRAAVFVGVYAGSSANAPSFRPHIGCIPGAGGGDRVPTSVSAVYPIGSPTIRRVTEVRLLPDRVRTVLRRCGRGEQVTDGTVTIGFFTAKPPLPALVSEVRTRLQVRSSGVTAVADAGSLADARTILQVAAVCGRGA